MSNPAERDQQVQCESAVSANSQEGKLHLGHIKHSNISWSRGDYPAVLSTGAPHPECCVQFWASQFKKDVKVSEGIQRRATKMVKGWEETRYKEHIRILGLSSLERTRLRGNFIAPYRFLRRGSGEGDADLPSHPVIGCVGMALSCISWGHFF